MPRIWTLESLNALNDEQLLLALANGEDLALDCLYQRHSGKVLQFALKRDLPKDRAQDLVQIVFLQLFRKKHLYNPKHAALAWLYVITKSELRDYRHREIKSFAPLNDSLSQNDDSAPIHEAQEESRQLLKKLKPREREAVEMRYIDDLEYEEIAERLNETESNVRQIISRALRFLRKKGASHEQK